ncbi:MarR family winged helix-turn-helix transcriptional regulator [Rhodohalobacter sp.]|uniref:MarR family winged helix-turn-helix transcriptional regulator n=1 Tax=Rhodohalobacter sp. TaxID=1974210 RepID=UPI002ACDC096|nr:MarR family transcriptional regulator [Rhodohalobacter sp.]MDZ7758236.1 MarR family transcriptional regulator [Rhodohalobacter sp.]
MHSQANTFSRSVSKHFDSYFKESGLATSYVEVLIFIKNEGSCLQKEIADHLNLDPSTITRFLKKLQKEDWVVKEKVEGRTKILLNSNREGEVKALQELYREAEEALSEMLGDKYVETTQKLLSHGNSLFDESDED